MNDQVRAAQVSVYSTALSGTDRDEIEKLIRVAREAKAKGITGRAELQEYLLEYGGWTDNLAYIIAMGWIVLYGMIQELLK